MRKITFLGIYLLSLFVASSAVSAPDTINDWGWRLPQAITDSNTKVIFKVDSTWHLIEGTTSGIKGSVWLDDSENPLSIRASISFPVKLFRTGRESRDERMREVMDSEHSPNVILAVDTLEPECKSSVFAEQRRCSVILNARITIRGVERPMKLTGIISRDPSGITLSGETSFLWADFGVEDPSILVAKLKPEVAVLYSITLAKISSKK